jgi:ribosomal protein S30
MSGINGDKARFHRERKKKIARRLRNEERWKTTGVDVKQAVAAPARPKPVSA